MRCLTYFLVFVLLSRGSRLVCRRFARPWFHISNKRDKRQLGAHWKFPRHVCSAAAKRERVVGNVATTPDSRVPFPGLSTESGVLYLNCNNLLEWRSPRKRMPPSSSSVRCPNCDKSPCASTWIATAIFGPEGCSLLSRSDEVSACSCGLPCPV